MRATYSNIVAWKKLLDNVADYARDAEAETVNADRERDLRRALNDPPPDVWADFGHTATQFGRAFLNTARALSTGSSPELTKPVYAGALRALASALSLILERHLLAMTGNRYGAED